ncbi:MAG TPA: helix-turn-helix domain-containing protein, partial [Longimicrobiaceae bacterium]|nr:helix-turn-helix domain-containing protein [Longimicrobiaceae bacterium]
HLATLREAELVSVERRGKSLVYSLNATALHDCVQGMLDLFGTGEERRAAVRSRRWSATPCPSPPSYHRA